MSEKARDLLCCGGESKNLFFFDTQEGSRIRTLERAHKDRTWCIKSVGSNRFASCSQDWTVKIWNLKNQKPIFLLGGHKNSVYSLDHLNVNGTDILASCSRDSTVKLWSLKEEKLLWTVEGHYETVRDVKFLSNNLLSSGSYDKKLTIWDIQKKLALKNFTDHTNMIRCLYYDKKSDLLYSSGNDKKIFVFSIRDMKRVGAFSVDDIVYSFLYLPKFGFLLTGDEKGNIVKYDLRKMKKFSETKTHDDIIWNIVPLNRAGERFATCSNDKKIKIWKSENLDKPLISKEETSIIQAIEFFKTDFVKKDATNVLSERLGVKEKKIEDLENKVSELSKKRNELEVELVKVKKEKNEKENKLKNVKKKSLEQNEEKNKKIKLLESSQEKKELLEKKKIIRKNEEIMKKRIEKIRKLEAKLRQNEEIRKKIEVDSQKSCEKIKKLEDKIKKYKRMKKNFKTKENSFEKQIKELQSVLLEKEKQSYGDSKMKRLLVYKDEEILNLKFRVSALLKELRIKISPDCREELVQFALREEKFKGDLYKKDKKIKKLENKIEYLRRRLSDKIEEKNKHRVNHSMKKVQFIKKEENFHKMLHANNKELFTLAVRVRALKKKLDEQREIITKLEDESLQKDIRITQLGGEVTITSRLFTTPVSKIGMQKHGNIFNYNRRSKTPTLLKKKAKSFSQPQRRKMRRNKRRFPSKFR